VEVEDADKNKSVVPNPSYTAWLARDQVVLRFLLNSLSPEILSHMLGLESTAEFGLLFFACAPRRLDLKCSTCGLLLMIPRNSISVLMNTSPR
jgi:hypothetical protein